MVYRLRRHWKDGTRAVVFAPLQASQRASALSGAYSRFVRENPGVPMLLWYQGRAEVLVGDEQRQKKRRDELSHEARW